MECTNSANLFSQVLFAELQQSIYAFDLYISLLK